MKREISAKIVSLMFDSCHRWGVDYQGIVIYTSQRLYLWSVVPTRDSKTDTFSDLLKKIVTELDAYNTTVVEICTNNSRANVSAFENNENHVVREPCAAHTAELAIGDMFKRDIEYGFISDEIQILMQNIPKECCRPGFKNELNTIRWTSLFDCSEYILENINSLQNSGSQIVLNSICKIESKIGFVNVVQMLKLMVIFVKEVEKDLSSISEVVYVCAEWRVE